MEELDGMQQPAAELDGIEDRCADDRVGDGGVGGNGTN
jgi:hypothetical protein